MINRYIAIDTETGGLSPDTSLLTAYFTILDENLDSKASLSLFVKPNNGVYSVTAQALSVNKINLIEHDKIAITYSKAGQDFRDFIIKHSDGGKLKLIPIGQNVYFDLERIYGLLLNKNEAQKYMSYRLLDTGVITQFYKLKGVIPDSISGGLGSLATYFNIDHGKAHTAEGDVNTTIEVLKKLKDIDSK